MSKHPLARRARLLAARTSVRQPAYGDGMFFFTRPVGAPMNYPEGRGENRNMNPRGEFAVTTGYTSGGDFLGDYYADGANTRPGGYGDGGFYFLQKFGQPAGGYGDVAMLNAPPSYGDVAMEEPQVIRMGFAGAVEAQYGAAGDHPGTLPQVRGMDIDIKTSSSGRPSGRGGQRAQTATVASPETVAAFEKAAEDYGRARFWYYVWNRNQSRKVGDVSRAEFRKRSEAFDAAKVAYETAREALLAGVPATFDRRGLGTNAVGTAFNKYELSLIEKGSLAEAYRNVKGKERTHAGSVFNALRDDLKKPFKGDYSNMTLDEALAIARGYFMSDVQSRMVDPGVDAHGTDVRDIWGKEALKNVDKTDFDAMSRAKRPIDQFVAALFTKSFRKQYKDARNAQDQARGNVTSQLLVNKEEFERLRAQAVEVATALATIAPAKSTATNAAQRAKTAADLAKSKRTETETKALGLDVAGTEAAAAATTQAATQADAAAKQAEAGLASVAAAFRALGQAGVSEKAAFDTIVRDARKSATDAGIDAQSAVARIEVVKAAKKAADDKAAADAAKAAADAAAGTVTTAQQAVDVAQRNLDTAKARLAQGQGTQAEVDAAQRALDEANARLTANKVEADRLAAAAAQAAANAQASANTAQALTERAENLGSKVPPGAMQPRGRGPKKVAEDKTSQAGGEGFFSKYSTELILGGAVLAIGGYFAWQKYYKK